MNTTLADHPRAIALEDAAIQARTPYVRVRDWLRRPSQPCIQDVLPRVLAPAACRTVGSAPFQLDAEAPGLLLLTADEREWNEVSATIVVPAGVEAELWIIGQGSGVSDAEIEITLGTGSILRVLHIAQWDTNATAFGRLKLTVAENARADIHDFQLDDGRTQLQLDARLAGENAALGLHSLSLLGDKSRAVLQADLRHDAESTVSRLDVRNAVTGSARRSVTGTVRVSPAGQQTDSEQIARSLLLSPRAGADMRPELEIYADQVKCAHGATCGELDQTALHYLRSRGLDVLTARQLLLESFALPLVQELPAAAAETLQPVISAALARLGRSLTSP